MSFPQRMFYIFIFVNSLCHELHSVGSSLTWAKFPQFRVKASNEYSGLHQGYELIWDTHTEGMTFKKTILNTNAAAKFCAGRATLSAKHYSIYQS
jgi:hypothetical protein